MNDADRKLLTEEVLEEKGHEPLSKGSPICICGVPLQKHRTHKIRNRTFTTWQDYGDVLEKIRPFHFIEWLDREKRPERDYKQTWLWWESLSPKERCQFVADWWKEGKK